MLRPLIIGAAALVAGLAAAASANAATFTFFQTPSKQIGCMYQTGPQYLRCDVMYPTRFNGTRTCREAGDAGQAFAMRARGRVQLPCASDTVFDPKARVIPYGTTRRFGPFRCAVSMAGLRCSNARGHGWFLSRQSQRRF